MKTRTKRAQHTRATRSLVRSKEEEEDVNLIPNHYIVIWLTIHRYSSSQQPSTTTTTLICQIKIEHRRGLHL